MNRFVTRLVAVSVLILVSGCGGPAISMEPVAVLATGSLRGASLRVDHALSPDGCVRVQLGRTWSTTYPHLTLWAHARHAKEGSVGLQAGLQARALGTDWVDVAWTGSMCASSPKDIVAWHAGTEDVGAVAWRLYACAVDCGEALVGEVDDEIGAEVYGGVD